MQNELSAFNLKELLNRILIHNTAMPAKTSLEIKYKDNPELIHLCYEKLLRISELNTLFTIWQL